MLIIQNNKIGFGAVKSTDFFSRGLGFKSQYPHVGSQLYVTLAPGDLLASSGFSGY